MLVNGSAATVMVWLGGLVLLAVSEGDGELEQAVESTARSARVLLVRVLGAPVCAAPAVGTGPCPPRAPGHLGVGQAVLALP